MASSHRHLFPSSSKQLLLPFYNWAPPPQSPLHQPIATTRISWRRTSSTAGHPCRVLRLILFLSPTPRCSCAEPSPSSQSLAAVPLLQLVLQQIPTNMRSMLQVSPRGDQRNLACGMSLASREQGVKDGQTFSPPDYRPPFFQFRLTADGTPSWVYQKSINHQGYSSNEMVTCKKGAPDTQLDKYEDDGPHFVKNYPKEAWTVCDIGREGGQDAGIHWYLFFANVEKEGGAVAGNINGGGICTTKCLIANNPSYGYAQAGKSPPCWQPMANGDFNCFNYGSDGKCPWPGMTDCPKQNPSLTPSTGDDEDGVLGAWWGPGLARKVKWWAS